MPDYDRPRSDVETTLDALRSDPNREVDPEVRDAVELQTRIDAALIRRFRAPAPSEMAERLRRALGEDAPESIPLRPAPAGWVRRVAVAAALLGGVFGTWLIADQLRPTPPSIYQRMAWQDFGTAYRSFVDDGFEPQWVCETDEIFAATFRDRLGHAVVLGDTSEPIEALGLRYCHTVSRDTIALLVRAREAPVVVFVDRAGRDATEVTREVGARLNRFERTIDDLVLYEVTPLDAPLVLSAFESVESGALTQ